MRSHLVRPEGSRRVVGLTPTSTPTVAAAMVLCLLAALLVALPAAPAAAEDRPLASTSVFTWNMQGANESGTGATNKWQNHVRTWALQYPIMMLQEAGALPARSAVHIGDRTLTTGGPGTGAPRTNHTVQHYIWDVVTASRSAVRHVYFVLTQDGRGGRVNIAMVVDGEPDEVNVVENPIDAGRIALGVRYGAHWYFTVHALSGGGGDAGQLLDAVDDEVLRWGEERGVDYRWTVGGDFNVEPQVLVGRNYFPPLAGAITTNVNTPTHNSGNRYDYFVTNERNTDLGDAYVLGGPPSDHRPVGAGRMRAAAEPPSAVRLMPVGDSITEGHGSSNESGYRGKLHDDLGKFTLGELLGWHESDRIYEPGFKRDLVGERRHGRDVPDADHQGWPGYTIAQIHNETSDAVASMRPNVVTLLAGTNDMVHDVDVANAPGRLSALIDQILVGSPGVAIVVGTLTPSADPGIQNRITAYNQAISTMLDNRIEGGDHLVRVDLGAVTLADLADGLHPNDQGYRKMADAFRAGVRTALIMGWVGEPGTPSDPVGPVRGWAPQGVVASGTMRPGAYPGALSLGSGDQVHFADLDGDGRADYLVTHPNQSVTQWTNGGINPDGTVTWLGPRTVSTLEAAIQPVWRFADIDADGRAEMIKYDSGSNFLQTYRADGTLVPHLNSGLPQARQHFADIDANGRADWLTVADNSSVIARMNLNGSVGPAKLVAGGVGVPGDRIRFADMDASGSADYLVLNADSSVQAWLNGGPGTGDELTWFPQGTVATGVGVSGDRIRFADIDGDRRADYLDVDPTTGNTRMWRSTGVWQWEPRGSITTGSSTRAVYADLDGNGSADYLQIQADSSVQAWLNGGRNPAGGEEWIWHGVGTVASGGGTSGSRVRFTDLDGNGLADYLVVNQDSSVRAWLNGGRDPSGAEQWLWHGLGTVANGVSARGDEIRFADIDTDGRADYVRVNDNSSVQAWLNGDRNPAGGEQWIWRFQGTVAGGVAAPGSQIRIADLTGDDRPDYLVLHENSSVDMWINGGPRPEGGEWLWLPQGQVAFGVGVPGSRVQFADLDGDGRDDYLDVDPQTGSTRAWINVP
ncbi:FG-GAP-like repeat-containing protein [Cellulomonas sp. S1-8]|uniref:FG-GAP-like repeat-containing protein n=1 Tax=Cellulomonas sp. S1-8 TaxID=2904790 RepID=UPI0022445E88|nr:FG-GAP-like repeat-containing protein [Cellulomonas sp. S1-8]UZN03804.1 FG-GAP-like repeat-containing protein [Cellulomonas sp. S1-8]